MKKFIFFFFLLLGTYLGAQTLTDLSSRLYHDLEAWEMQGYIYQLPLLRPYSGIILSALLKEAEEKGSSEVREKVQKYRKRYLSPLSLPNLSFKHDSFAKIQDRFDYFGVWRGIIQESALINDYLSLDVNFESLLLQCTNQNAAQDPRSINNLMLPLGQEIGLEYFVDRGQFSALGSIFTVSANYSLISGIGNEIFSGQAGFTRTSFAEMDTDALALSPHAFRAPHFSYFWRTSSFVLTSLFMSLNASPWTGQSMSTSGKYLNFFSFSWKPASLIELTAYTTAIYGQRIAPEYFLPGIYTILTQFSGNIDNVFFGGMARLFFPGNVKLGMDFYLDDMKFLQVFAGQFQFLTSCKMAFTVNGQWAPEGSFLDRLSISYTAVMPYTYTHNPEFIDSFGNKLTNDNLNANPRLPNYSDATHMGAPIGTILKPNSDRLQLSAQFYGPMNLLINAAATYLRHGNVSENVDRNQYPYLNQVLEAGSIFDTGYDLSGNQKNLFDRQGLFLSQSVIEHSLQASLGIQWSLEFPCWTVIPKLKFTGEWYMNRGLSEGKNGFTPNIWFSVEWLF